MVTVYVLATYTGHDASVALVGHGRIVHLEKERFTRRKHDSGNVDDLRAEACRQMGIAETEISATAKIGPGDEGAVWQGHINQTRQLGAHEWLLPHHLAHAAYAFYTSPCESAGIITIDGGGDGLVREGSAQQECVAMSVGHTIHRFGDTAFAPMNLQVSEEESPGHRWNGISGELFNDSGPFGAGKVMALGGVTLDHFTTVTGFSLRVRETIRVLQDDTTASFHRAADTALARGAGALALAGGCALNGIATEALRRRQDVEWVHVPPAVHDGGLTVGAALYVLHRLLGVPRLRYAPATVAFAGYSDGQEGAPVIGQIADALVASKIVCLARGRAESGPRALGHRSILADPRDVEMRARLNAMKGRHAWRPVAPVTYVEDMFCDAQNFFMTLITEDPRIRRAAPAAIHDDDTARVQFAPMTSTLGKIVAAFRERTGVAYVLNTSFNCGGEAMVNTPADAASSFVRLGADLLVVGGEIVDA